VTVPSIVVLLAVQVARPATFSVDQVPNVRSVSNYLFQEDTFELEPWERDLDGIKDRGFNTVWIVNVWGAFQPSVEGDYDEDKLEWLQGVCREAGERDMYVLLVVAYIGEGWGPRGVDVPVWPLVPKHRAQHLAYLRWLSEGVGGYDNVFYLLCTEEILPATLLYRPAERPECIAAFRSWARRTSPDVAYWNERWKTDYTWETLRPAATSERPTWQTWSDHGRWFTYLMQQLLPPMTAAIRDGDPDAVIGFHDFLLSTDLKQPAEERPQADRCGFDFFSIGYYYRPEKQFDENLEALRERVEVAREYYPDIPLLCGEIGMAVRKSPPEAMKADEEVQARWLKDGLTYLRQEGVGYSIWSWRTKVPSAEAIHSLHRADGSPRPALEVIENTHREQPRQHDS
jgi:hypothetical protein